MANKCDRAIYGCDENSFASKIASDALSTSQGNEGAWGGKVIVQDAEAKGNAPNSNTEVIQRSLKQDGSGKKSEGN